MAPRRKQSATVDIKIRMKEPLRAEIERAAKRRGVSMNTEMVDRLEQAYRAEEALGGPRTAALLRALAEIGKFEGGEGDTWLDNYMLHAVIAESWRKTIEEAGPDVPEEIRDKMNFYVETLERLERNEFAGEYRERIIKVLGYAASDVRLPLELRAQLAAVANVDIG